MAQGGRMAAKDVPGPYAFLKLGKQEHIEALQTRGSMHFETLDYFRRGEDGNVRFDSDEGLHSIIQGPSMKVEFSARGRTFLSDSGGKLVHSLKIMQPNLDAVNIFCLTAILSIGRFPFHPGFRTFGDACLVITDLVEFSRRVRKGIEARVRAADSAPVEYVSPTAHVGDMGRFRKFQRYAWQQEYRIAVEPLIYTGGAMDFDVGSLGDISFMMETERLFDANFLPESRQ